MNTNLFGIVKQIAAEHGESILNEPRRVSAFFSDLARDIPKPQKNAFVKCLEHGFAQTLKNVSVTDRAACKQQLVEKLHGEEGFDPGLCGETLDLLALVLFGEEKPKGTISGTKLQAGGSPGKGQGGQQGMPKCKSCGMEMQAEWKACPHCGTAAGKAKSIPNAQSAGEKEYQEWLEKIKNGGDLKDVPEKLKTYELCMTAVKQNGWNFEYVPEKHKTFELCMAAVEAYRNALEYVPEKHKTFELCQAAVEQSATALEYVPEKLKTFEFCLAVIRKHGRGYLSSELMSPAILDKVSKATYR
jgi:hypothetical protein